MLIRREYQPTEACRNNQRQSGETSMFINSIYPKHPDTNNEASNGQQQKLFPGHHFNYHRDS